jgi:radical SAM superfamily enzyme YgiQ (UPF0313 family)
VEYDYPVYRPPSEAYSLILQVSIGCSHNACTFCTMYKSKRFRIKTSPEIEEMIRETSRDYPRVSRVFLADGNALSLPTELLLKTLDLLYARFPRLERVSIYGGPADILAKTPEELQQLKKHRLDLVYLGVESGSERILQAVKKGVSPADMTAAGQKVKSSGLGLSVTLISGLGGKDFWEEHAQESSRVISAIMPDYLALLTLTLDQGAPLLKDVETGKFSFLTPWEILRETRLLIENLNLKRCIFRSNHASNYFSLGGVLNEEKEKLLQAVDAALDSPEIKRLAATNDRRL